MFDRMLDRGRTEPGCGGQALVHPHLLAAVEARGLVAVVRVGGQAAGVGRLFVDGGVAADGAVLDRKHAAVTGRLRTVTLNTCPTSATTYDWKTE